MLAPKRDYLDWDRTERNSSTQSNRGIFSVVVNPDKQKNEPKKKKKRVTIAFSIRSLYASFAKHRLFCLIYLLLRDLSCPLINESKVRASICKSISIILCCQILQSKNVVPQGADYYYKKWDSRVCPSSYFWPNVLLVCQNNLISSFILRYHLSVKWFGSALRHHHQCFLLAARKREAYIVCSLKKTRPI